MPGQLAFDEDLPVPSRHPAVIAYHLCWTAYGTWLPNDPRGSGSHSVATSALAEMGTLHFGRRKSQPPPAAVREFYREAEPQLKFSVSRFDAAQVAAIGAALVKAIAEHRYTCYACAILSDHLHLVIRKHRDRAEAMIENLQHATRLRLSGARHIPHDHPCWTEGGWRGFLDTPSAVRSVIHYVEENPAKAGLPPQHWPFVAAYDGWPFHKTRSTRGT